MQIYSKKMDMSMSELKHILWILPIILCALLLDEILKSRNSNYYLSWELPPIFNSYWQIKWAVLFDNLYQHTVFKVKSNSDNKYQYSCLDGDGNFRKLLILFWKYIIQRNGYVFTSVQMDILGCSDNIVWTFLWWNIETHELEIFLVLRTTKNC